MPWDDDADDERSGLGPPLPPDDRLWRHPSELSRPATPTTSGPGLRGTSVGWAAVAAAGLGGAAITFGVLSVAGGLSTRVVEQPVVEKVAVAPLLSSPMLGSGQGLDAVTAKIAAAVVRLELHVDGPDRTASGVIFRDDGLILTSAGPLQGQSSLTAVLADGRRLEAAVLGVDELTDVAVVKVGGHKLPVAVLGSSHDLEVGAAAIVVGSPEGSEGALATTGLVSAVDRRVPTVEGGWLHGMIQTDAEVDRGSLGGPLLDRSGAVVGITSSLPDEEGAAVAFATPVEVARRVAGQLIEHGRALHGWLGVAGEDVTVSDARRAGFGSGAVVRRVAPGSPADRAGLRADDVITRLDDVAIRSMSGLVLALREHVPGEALLLAYWRDGDRAETTVSLAERPPDET